MQILGSTQPTVGYFSTFYATLLLSVISHFRFKSDKTIPSRWQRPSKGKLAANHIVYEIKKFDVFKRRE